MPMTPEELNRWKREILGRLDVLKTKARHARQYLEAHDLDALEDKQDIVEAWRRVQERFPEDLDPPRVGDLNRHLGFAMPHDFSDIETLDIPAIEGAVERYGRRSDEFIAHELAVLEVGLEAWELLHPQVRDACMTQFENGLYRDAARAGIELIMDEIRRYTGRQDDGDPLLRAVVGVGRRIGFSPNSDDNERGVTEGLKMILQGLYKGVRNPASHGYGGYSRLEAFQILVMCSFLLGRMRLVSGEAD
jgi:uncharacterized protein (TIGR02391 family)